MAGKKPKAEKTPPAEGAEGEPASKKKLPLKMLIIGGVAGVLVLGGGGTAAMMFLGGGDKAEAGGDHAPKKKPKKKEAGHGGKEGEAPAYGEVKEGPDGVVFYTLPDLVANIRTSDGKPAFLKLKLTLELPDEHTADVFEPNAPRLSDMFTTFLCAWSCSGE
jgi:flagellar FliL protein